MRYLRLLLLVCCSFGALGAEPLLTPQVPGWAQDAVHTLRERGLFSAGMTPHQALCRSEMMPVLEGWLERESRHQQSLAPRSDLEEVRAWLRSLQQETERLEQRVDSL
jgi:hypothetical protein